jgi:uncharacterized membrane protein YedE/YeeE
MLPDTDPASAARHVIWGGLVLGLLLGAVGQSSRFCVRGAIADWMVFRGPGRLVSWLLAIGVAAVSVQLLISLQVFDPTRTLAWSDRFLWASYLVGGGLFGFGMILAQGCPQRSLVKAGSGNLKAIVTLLVIAITAAMTLRGAFAGVRVGWLDAFGVSLGRSQDFGSLLGAATGVAPVAWRWLLALALLAGVLALAWRLRASLERAHWIGGIGVGLLVAGAFFVTGKLGFVAELPDTLEPGWLGTQSKRPEGLSFSAPMAHALDLLTLWSDKNTLATFGVTLSLGVLVGAFVTAKLRGDFRLETFGSPRELGEHLLGGVLMGFGGITAVGCSIGNGVTGLAMLSAGSLLAVAGIVGGAVLALRLQIRKAEAQPLTATAVTRAA